MNKANRLMALFLTVGVIAAYGEAESIRGANVARAGDDRPTILLATTTSTENSGLLDYLHPYFERATGIHVRVLARGTGAALRAGRDGNCDVLLVHDRERELQFVRDGFGVYHHPVMYNDFVLVGSPEDPAGVKDEADIADAFMTIARRESYFISRGDDSGTHAREKEIWRSAGFTPTESDGWYLSVGQGMAKTLTIAYEKRGYTLADRGTFLSQKNRLDLEIMVEGDTRLHNPYGAMAVNPARHPHVRYENARRYIDWLVSPEGQRLISEYTIEGEQLFHPDALARDVPDEPSPAGPELDRAGDS